MARTKSHQTATKAARTGRGKRSTASAPYRPSKPELFCAQYQDYSGLEVVHPHAAGIDIGGSLSHFVALEIAPKTLEVREFGCNTEDLRELRDYLLKYRVTTVALESTGVYWIPVANILGDAGIHVCLVNPSQVKNVPGRRKDDKLDCRWLLTLHTFGLLSASFRPSAEILPLRAIWRERQQIIDLQADEIRRMHKSLDEMNIRPHKMISDLAGVTGQAIVRAILAGERDPEVLAGLRDCRIKCSEEELRQALTGDYRSECIFLLGKAFERYHYYQQQIVACDTEIEARLKALIPMDDDDIAAKVQQAGVRKSQTRTAERKHLPAFDLAGYLALLVGEDLTSLPGFGPILAMTMVTELGIDMSAWPTEKHFTSYLNLSPKHDISGGKILSRRTRKSQQRASAGFRQAATAVKRMNTALGAFHRRVEVPIGSAKAQVATARKIAVLYYRLMRYGQAYTEAGAEAYEEKYRTQQLKQVRRRAKTLGYELVPIAA